MRYGVQLNDSLLSINNTPLHAWHQIEGILKKQDPRRPLNMEIRSGQTGKILSIAVASTVDENPIDLKSLGIENPLLFISEVRPRSLGDLAGIKVNDRLLMAQGQYVDPGFNLKRFSEYIQREKKMTLAVVRGPEVQHLELKDAGIPNATDEGYEGLLKFLGLRSYWRPAPAAEANDADRLMVLRYFVTTSLGSL
jgi:hypothetical protein